MLIPILADGSRADAAIHDPFFWAIVGASAFFISLAAAQRQGVAGPAAAVAGATAMLAAMLPVLPRFDSESLELNAVTIQMSLRILSHELGTAGTVVLLMLWVRAIIWRYSGTDFVDIRYGTGGAVCRAPAVPGRGYAVTEIQCAVDDRAWDVRRSRIVTSRGGHRNEDNVRRRKRRRTRDMNSPAAQPLTGHDLPATIQTRRS